MCFGCSKEPSQWDSSFEYPQHMFWLRNKKNNILLRTLIWGPAYWYIKYNIVHFKVLSVIFFGWNYVFLVPEDDLCLFGLMFYAPVNSYGHVGTYFQSKS